VLLAAFGATLVYPPSMIFRFALLMDRKGKIRGTLGEKHIAAYCRTVTVLWCLFFVVNGGIAAFTVFRSSEAVWALYNGGISYILIGILFGAELLVRTMKDKFIPRAIPLSAFTPASRPGKTVMCYSGSYSGGVYKTWDDFLAGTAVLRGLIEKEEKQRWILYCNDYWYFLLAYTALLQCKKEVLLSANISPAYMAEIIAGAGTAAFLTDERDALKLADASFYVPALVEESSAALDMRSVPPINADETVIVMYSSGTTGEPKAIRQRLTEFENDNAFILSKWGEEFLKRKLCSTVSPHHIYGLLFSVMLPFTAAVPFRRERIEYPESFEQLRDDSYLIITVPALLKRVVEIAGTAFGLRDPWIFTSGGAVPPDVALQTEQVFGFWPLEVYGSTETSGIAWRQSRDGPEWTPFDNAEIRQNEEGCLVIKSPYIKDPAGFVTGDMAEMLPDGRFLLKGRADSIVKIEEKRISLPEVESRIMQSGLVSDAAVIALEDRRQYLAAVLVFNEKGKVQFAGLEKFRINQYFWKHLTQFFENMVIPKKWRYLEALPRNPQGKIKKQELEALFRNGRTISLPQGITGTVIEQSKDSGVFEFAVPESCPYFDGHFPEFKILPAVAQFELILACAAHLVPAEGFPVSGSRRIKFSNIIHPNVKLHLELTLRRREKTLRFTIRSADGFAAKIFAAGTILLGEPSFHGPGGEIR
jgi:acyl-coenzyme A synthetase/AMP-(fatty) acid ligase/3-hydroxymyristoyl/3-hydroxydecanoyl-(acyl carrier protein) dehydratase